MAGFFGNYTSLVTLDLTSESNVTTLGGVVNGTGDIFNASGYTPSLTSNIDFLTGNSISASLPVGWKNAGTIAIQFDPRALAVDQNQLFDPSTANSGNPMDNDDFTQSSGNTEIGSNAVLLSMLSTAFAGNELIISRLFAGTKQTLLSVNSSNTGATTDSTTGISSVGGSLKWGWLTWNYASSVLTVDWWVDGIKVATFASLGNNPFQDNFDEFYIGGTGGAGIGSYPIKQVQWIDGYYTRAGDSQINTFGDSFYQRGYPYPGGSSAASDAPRFDSQWMIQASKGLLENQNKDVVFFNEANGGWGWSESTHSGSSQWLGNPVAIANMLQRATYVVMSPSPNDITPTSTVPADLESSSRSILQSIIDDYPNIQGILLTNTIPWTLPTSKNTGANQTAVTTVNSMYQSLAAEFAKITFFDVFTPMGGFTMDRDYCVGSGIEDAVNDAAGDTTNSDINNIHLSPLGAVQLSSVMEQPLSTLLTRRSMTDIVIGIPPEKPSILAADLLRATGTYNTSSHSQPTANGANYSALIPEGYEVYEVGFYGSSADASTTTTQMGVYAAAANGTLNGFDIIEATRSSVPTIDNTTDFAANIFTIDPAVPVPAGWHGVAFCDEGASHSIQSASSTVDEIGSGQRASNIVDGTLDTTWANINQAVGITGNIVWARLRPVATTAPTLTTPYSIGTNNGPLFVATSSETIATVEGAGFLNDRAGWASLLKTGDTIIIQCSNGTKMYNLTVNVQARIITLSTGLAIA